MYSGLKFESDYSEGASGKLHSRGIALVRRDNAKLVRTVMKETLALMLRRDARASDALGAVARHIALVEASARSMHRANRPAEHLPVEQFVLSAGISKGLDEYVGVANSAAVIAQKLMDKNPLEKIGAGARVTFVIAQAEPDARRAEQAELVSDLLSQKKSLDAQYYVEAIRAKCEPLLSAMFVAEERARATVRTATGGTLVLAPKRKADLAKLPGQLEAERRLEEAAEAARKARAALEPRGERPTVNAFDVMKAGAVSASKKRKKM
jgi:DNA polymerase elongation subunit (family B)